MEMKVLSIDAWRGYEGGWDWNAWYNAGTIELTEKELDNNRTILRKMRKEGFLSDYSKGRVAVHDDQYNIVIEDRSNGRPIFAIEYGPALGI